MKRTVLLLLAVLLAISGMLTACGSTNDPGSETTPSGNNSGDQTDSGDPAATPDIPADYQIGGEFRVLGYNANVSEFGEADAETSDSVNEELIGRDFWLEERLDVYLTVDTSHNGQYADVNSYVELVEQSVFAGNASWDLIGTYSLTPPLLAQRGLLVDLQDYSQFINTSKVWWPEYLVDACTINDRTYFLSGDISSSLLYNMQVVVFDADRAAANQLPETELYRMVYDNEWTLERLFELAQNMSQDNGDGTWNTEDFYGITMESANMLDSFYFATGLTTLNENEDGYLEISSDINGEAMLDIYNMVYSSINTYHSMTFQTGGNNPMADGKSVFGINTVYQFRTALREEVDHLRVLPFPKYLAGDTTGYLTLVSNPHTQYCIPDDIDDAEHSAVFMEMMAYASYDRVTPIIFGEAMKLQYSQNEDVSNMFDIIRAGCTTDVGILYALSFDYGYEPLSMFRNAVQLNLTNLVSNFEQNYRPGMTEVTGELNDFYHS